MTRGDWSDKLDFELMDAIADHNEDALECLIERFLPTALGVSHRVLGDFVDAEEVVADVFVQLWRSPEKFDKSRGPVRSYILILTRSRSLDRLRSKIREKAKLDCEVPVSETTSGEDVFAGAYLSDLSELVRQALSKLPARQRQAIELAFFGGKTHAEIAESLSTPLGTIKAQIRRGLLKLRSLMSPIDVGDEK